MFHSSLPSALLFFVFLGFLVALVLVLVTVLARTRPDGSPVARICVGCGAGCALGCLGCLGLAALALSLALLTGSAIVRNGPVHSVQVERGASVLAEPGTSEERTVHPVHVRIEVRGDVHMNGVEEWLRKETGKEVSSEATRTRGPDGGVRTRLDFWLHVPDGEMRNLERKLRRNLPSLGLPRSLTITLGQDA